MMRLIALAALLAPNPFEISPTAGSHLTLEVFKSGLWNGRKHTFTFDRFHGSLEYDAQAPERSQVKFTAEAKSIALHDTWVSEKDRGKIVKYALTDMLDADRHPDLSFASTRIIASATGKFQVQGTLSIRGVAKPVTVDVALKPDFTIEGNASLRMSDWGMKPPSAALGTIGTRDEMKVAFAVKAVAH